MNKFDEILAAGSDDFAQHEFSRDEVAEILIDAYRKEND